LRPVFLWVLLSLLPALLLAACDAGADPLTAPDQCALNFNISSPYAWSQHAFNSTPSLNWSVYNAADGQPLSDACVNASFENGALFTAGEPSGNFTFHANASGTPKLSLVASRPGCASVAREVYIYVRNQGPAYSFPELPVWFAPLLALAALGFLRKAY